VRTALLIACAASAIAQGPHQANGIKIGEVDQHSAIVWTRLTRDAKAVTDGADWINTKNKTAGNEQIPTGKTLDQMNGAVPGAPGAVRVVAQSADGDTHETDWATTDASTDFTHQFRLTGLKPGVAYTVRVESRGQDDVKGQTVAGAFRTAPATDKPAKITFAVVTGQGYWRRDDGNHGHKIYRHMLTLNPDFFVHTGDIEYYDKARPWATNASLCRHKWNRLYALPNQIAFHNRTASYFIKDDHDTLKNDAWPGQTYGDLTWQRGLELFREQVPMGHKTYRTIRWGKDLQVWLVEGRDFRSSNKAPDGPDKTIWGAEQMAWLKKTITASDAAFRILISPTPIVGPDRTNKGDNHANQAFAHEGKHVRAFLAGLKNTAVICGDRHWQYHSVDPATGLNEFSCGPTSDQHAGGWKQSDFRKTIHKHLKVAGGFFTATVDRNGGRPILTARFYGIDGQVFYEHALKAN